MAHARRGLRPQCHRVTHIGQPAARPERAKTPAGRRRQGSGRRQGRGRASFREGEQGQMVPPSHSSLYYANPSCARAAAAEGRGAPAGVRGGAGARSGEGRAAELRTAAGQNPPSGPARRPAPPAEMTRPQTKGQREQTGAGACVRCGLESEDRHPARAVAAGGAWAEDGAPTPPRCGHTETGNGAAAVRRPEGGAGEGGTGPGHDGRRAVTSDSCCRVSRAICCAGLFAERGEKRRVGGARDAGSRQAAPTPDTIRHRCSEPFLRRLGSVRSAVRPSGSADRAPLQAARRCPTAAVRAETAAAGVGVRSRHFPAA